ncbi:MAG: DNA replication and repair protein RecF [Candidatus Saccharibacteria bacterium]|nr:DNA replication and repair protein RecF [Candidatus Saccharibacteria bacterium]
MIIKSIKLSNFRCHETFNFDFKKKTSVIIGENGSGKTSVLEAIYIALSGKSFRATDTDIIKRGAEFYRIEVDFLSGEKTVVVYGDNNGVFKKQFLVGEKKNLRLPKKYRYPVVLFLPGDLHLIESSPTRKRDFFDRILSELDDSYSSLLSRYEKALRQRNDLLKKCSEYSLEEVRPMIFSWNVMLAKYGVEIRERREKMIAEINSRLTSTYRSIAENSDEVLVSYNLQGDSVSESEYLARLESELSRDLILGHTGFGAHRDNYEFIFNGSEANGSASRGEVRSIILALKFIEAEMIYERVGKRPIVLLDDVFSELDETRQKSLTSNFKDNQVIITSVDVVD